VARPYSAPRERVWDRAASYKPGTEVVKRKRNKTGSHIQIIDSNYLRSYTSVYLATIRVRVRAGSGYIVYIIKYKLPVSQRIASGRG